MKGVRHVPGSTGLPSDRPPTRAEAWELWRRQVLGSGRLLRAQSTRVAPPARTAWFLIGAQITIGLLLLPVLASGTELVRLVPQALFVCAVALTVLWSLQCYSIVTQASLVDVTEKSLRVVRASPLPAGAWMLGRTLVLAGSYFWGVGLLSPILLTGAALSGRSLGSILLFVITPLAGLPVTIALTSLGLAKAEDPPPVRRKASAAMLQPQGAQAQQQAAQLIVLIPMLVIIPAVMLMGMSGGSSIFSMFGWLAAIIPAFAGISAVSPALTANIAGHSFPSWVPCLALYSAFTPFVWSLARLRTKPADSPRGHELRISALVAWAALAALAGFAFTGTAANPFGVMPKILHAAPLVVALAAGAWAGASAIGDLAAERTRGVWRLTALVRSTAEAHAALAVAVVLAALVLAGGWPRTGGLGLWASLLFLALPACVVGAVFGRCVWRSAEGLRFEKAGPTGSWVATLPLLWILAGVGALALVSAVAAGELDAAAFPPGVLRLCDLIASSSPVAAPDDLLRARLSGAGSTIGLPRLETPLTIGFGLQVLVCAATWSLDRWANRRWERWKTSADEPEDGDPPPAGAAAA